MNVGLNTNQDVASNYHPTRTYFTLTGWYDANDNIMFDAQGRAVDGTYWNGSYVPGSSSATWKYAGDVTTYAHWEANEGFYELTFYGGGKTLGSVAV